MRSGSIGERVKAAREARGWSVRELARQSELSDTMIRKIERDEVNPGVEVLGRVAEALSIQKSWVFFGELLDVQIVVSPTFVPTDEAVKFKARATGSEKVVPDPAKYLDPEGCTAYLSLVSEASYKAALEGAPLRDLSTAVQELTADQPVNLVCLGSGHARYEDRFLNLLLTRCNVASVCCVDISASLLIIGGRRICDTLRAWPSVQSTFVYGDFLTLSWELALRPNHRNILTMFGYTYCNLEGDDFLRTLPINRGDLVILDITLAAEPPQSDPALNRSIDFRSRLFEFLMSPLMKTHRADQLRITEELELTDTDYVVKMIAQADTGERYTVGIVKRLSLTHLAAQVAPEYVIRHVFPYSELRAMVLLERQ